MLKVFYWKRWFFILHIYNTTSFSWGERGVVVWLTTSLSPNLNFSGVCIYAIQSSCALSCYERERSWRQRKVQALYRYCKCMHLSFISNPPFLKIWNFSYCLLLHWEIHYTGLWSSADQCNCFGSPTLLYGYKLCETLHVPRKDTAIACLVLIQKSCSVKNIKGGLPSWAFADNFTLSFKKDRMLDLFKGGGKVISYNDL